MNTDVYFTQGSTHRICEDYALASEKQVVISDGCSTGVHTDFGARLLSAAATQQNKQSLQDEERWSRILASADVYRKSLGLPIQSLAATLLIARIIEDEHPYIAVDMIGDGTVAARFRGSNTYVVHNINFPSGAPYYIRYNLSNEDQKTWGEKFGWKRKCTVGTWTVNESNLSQKSELFFGKEQNKIIADTYKFPICHYDLVVLTSDGAESFLTTEASGETRRISMFEIFQEVLAFKNTRGEFVHKRCVKSFRIFRDRGWINADDFSLAAITGD